MSFCIALTVKKGVTEINMEPYPASLIYFGSLRKVNGSCE